MWSRRNSRLIELAHVVGVLLIMGSAISMQIGSVPQPMMAAQPAAGGTPKVADIPVPADAESVEYEKLTKMIEVTSPGDVSTLARFYTDTLAAQGWTKDPFGVVTDDAAVVKVSKGDANLTIIINRDGEKSSVNVISEGLSWDAVPGSKQAPKNKAAAQPKASPRNSAPPTPRTTGNGRASATPPAPPPPAAPRINYQRVSPAEQKQSGVTIWTEGKAHKLEYGVAYQVTEDDKTETHVLLAEKPLPVDQIATLLAKKEDADDALGFQRHMKLRFEPDGKLAYLFMYSDGLSINSGYPDPEEMQAEITVENGRARGKVATVKPGKLFDHEYRFQAAFDAKLITGAGIAAGNTALTPEPPADGLLAEDQDGLPAPHNRTSFSSQGSQFRKSIDVEVPAPAKSVVDFYRRELASRGWKEAAATPAGSPDQTQLTFTGPEGSLTLQVLPQGDKAAAKIAVRYSDKARAAGILPQAGKGRLVLANASDREMTIVINGSPYKVAAGKGARDPKDGVSLHVQPGRYNITVKSPGQPDASEPLDVKLDETWGVIVLPTGGHLADQIY